MDPADIDIMMGTFTKSFGSCGGYIAANRCALAVHLGSGVKCSLMGMYAGLSRLCGGLIAANRRAREAAPALGCSSPRAPVLAVLHLRLSDSPVLAGDCDQASRSGNRRNPGALCGAGT